ncbi:uncharacterized protein LOC135108505 isoform X2 [Scylla paramamosain]
MRGSASSDNSPRRYGDVTGRHRALPLPWSVGPGGNHSTGVVGRPGCPWHAASPAAHRSKSPAMSKATTGVSRTSSRASSKSLERSRSEADGPSSSEFELPCS